MAFSIEKNGDLHKFIFIFIIDTNDIKNEFKIDTSILSFRYFIELLKKGLVCLFSIFYRFYIVFSLKKYQKIEKVKIQNPLKKFLFAEFELYTIQHIY